jgi:hypothetical protein
MTPRIICPHCHCAIDPLTLEAAVSAQAQYRICPECDGPIALFMSAADEGEIAPAPELLRGERTRSHAAGH